MAIPNIEVIRKLGGYDNCEEHAERLIQAQKKGYSPDAWLERIHILRSDAIRDRNMTMRFDQNDWEETSCSAGIPFIYLMRFVLPICF
jgi:hypothetical protein